MKKRQSKKTMTKKKTTAAKSIARRKIARPAAAGAGSRSQHALKKFQADVRREETSPLPLRQFGAHRPAPAANAMQPTMVRLPPPTLARLERLAQAMAPSWAGKWRPASIAIRACIEAGLDHVEQKYAKQLAALGPGEQDAATP